MPGNAWVCPLCGTDARRYRHHGDCPLDTGRRIEGQAAELQPYDAQPRGT